MSRRCREEDFVEKILESCSMMEKVFAALKCVANIWGGGLDTPNVGWLRPILVQVWEFRRYLTMQPIVPQK